MFEHEHPLNLIDLWSEQLHDEEEYEEESEDELIANHDFRCLCFRCEEEINWFHRYYYKCCQCDYSIHKFCAELPESLEDICHAHTLYLLQPCKGWICDICDRHHKPQDLSYCCNECDFDVDISCATKRLLKNSIYHPSHIHPLVCMTNQILSKCDACGREHKGIFYCCTICLGSFTHSHCAFLPKKLQIQNTTNDIFSHIHPLTLAYCFPEEDQIAKFSPLCRVCRMSFDNESLWIYKCDKCRYYTHLDCATSRNEPFMSILTSPGTGKTFKNYEDSQHPNLLHLPFLDPSYSILKHLFFKEDGSSTSITHDTSHQHPLILKDVECTDITLVPTSSRMKSISYHDPMKRIELLCDGCVRPIMSGPIYMCANEVEHCNFVLHEWCSQLPTELKDHYDHPEHTLVLHSKITRNFFGVFECDICRLHCNGFVYSCEECEYYIDVNCAFLPEEITHNSHPNHLLSRVNLQRKIGDFCRMCGPIISGYAFACHTCDKFHLHVTCALLIPETTTNKCDKHPMKLSYFPIENHKSDYFCEICENELDPEVPFYHCHECMQSMHSGCAPSIIRYETYDQSGQGVYEFVNVKFGGTYNNIKVHRHPLSFVQGTASDGRCGDCLRTLQFKMIFKCLNCEFAIHYDCCGKCERTFGRWRFTGKLNRSHLLSF